MLAVSVVDGKKLTSCSWHRAVTGKHCPTLRGAAGLADVAGGGTCAGTGTGTSAT